MYTIHCVWVLLQENERVAWSISVHLAKSKFAPNCIHCIRFHCWITKLRFQKVNYKCNMFNYQLLGCSMIYAMYRTKLFSVHRNKLFFLKLDILRCAELHINWFAHLGGMESNFVFPFYCICIYVYLGSSEFLFVELLWREL